MAVGRAVGKVGAVAGVGAVLHRTGVAAAVAVVVAVAGAEAGKIGRCMLETGGRRGSGVEMESIPQYKRCVWRTHANEKKKWFTRTHFLKTMIL